MSEQTKVKTNALEAKSDHRSHEVRRSDVAPSAHLDSPYDQVYFLQRTIGNQAVLSLIQSGYIQTKLKMGGAGDKYEQEADRKADEILRMPEAPAGKESPHRRPIQSRGPAGRDDPLGEIRCKPVDPAPLPTISPNIEAGVRSLRGGGQPLPPTERSFFEAHLGHDLSQVRLHTDSRATGLAHGLRAKTFRFG